MTCQPHDLTSSSSYSSEQHVIIELYPEGRSINTTQFSAMGRYFGAQNPRSYYYEMSEMRTNTQVVNLIRSEI